MHSPEAHSLLLDRLSERLQGTPELWREVFLGNTFADIRFEERTLTLLWTDAPACWSAGELVVLASRYDGRTEQVDADAALLTFEGPEPALRAAKALQALAASTPVTCLVSTKSCALAWFAVDGQPRRVLLPPRVLVEGQEHPAPAAQADVQPAAAEQAHPPGALHPHVMGPAAIAGAKPHRPV
ncbi:hypothetical protein HK414_10965 [Ramlibacter terrae]|uniref:Uncharacterized protein n=1 Tax=Ramlibacter terrae TaxID=2732511 RepID=A0ABX6P3N6_9BURK|nr:hypothetical protein HK414_10965 [Ramlibacter terrae]